MHCWLRLVVRIALLVEAKGENSACWLRLVVRISLLVEAGDESSAC